MLCGGVCSPVCPGAGGGCIRVCVLCLPLCPGPAGVCVGVCVCCVYLCVLGQQVCVLVVDLAQLVHHPAVVPVLDTQLAVDLRPQRASQAVQRVPLGGHPSQALEGGGRDRRMIEEDRQDTTEDE